MFTGKVLKIALRSWDTLVCFEILYRVVSFGLLDGLQYAFKDALLAVGGTPLLSQENIGLVLASPRAVLLLLGGLLLAAYGAYFELAALLLTCEHGWRGEYVPLWALLKSSFAASIRVFDCRNLPVFLLLSPALALSALPMATGVFKGVRLPEFVVDYMRSRPWLLALFAVALAALHVLLFFYAFCFPDVVLRGEHLLGSLGGSARLLRGKKIKTAGYLLACLAVAALAALAGFCCLALLLWGWCQWGRGGRGLFALLFLKWGGMASVALDFFSALTVYAAITLLCHRYRGQEQPPAPAANGRRPLLRRAATMLAALLLLGFYSETEIGGGLAVSPNPATEIVAHRAGAAYAPENTLAALEEAIAAGADMAEIDIRQTGDGVLVALHDISLKRTAGLDREVHKTGYATLKGLEAGSFFAAKFAGEPIPTLEQMLAAAKGRIRLMVELKAAPGQANLAREAVRQIRAAGMQGQCLLASMQLETLRQCKELAPAIETVYISSLLYSQLYDIGYVDAYSVETSFLTAQLVAQAKGVGKKVYAWTANQGESMKKILRLGADGLITDHPALAGYYREHADDNLLLEFVTGLLYP